MGFPDCFYQNHTQPPTIISPSFLCMFLHSFNHYLTGRIYILGSWVTVCAPAHENMSSKWQEFCFIHCYSPVPRSEPGTQPGWKKGVRGRRKENSMEGSGEEERRRTRVMNSHVPPTSRRAATPPCPLITLMHKQDFPQTGAQDQGSQTQILQGPGTYAGEKSKTV